MSQSECYYSTETNTLMLLALLHAYGIKRVIVSPGGTNVNLVWSLQRDPFFEVYSAVDERHAAYLACGMATASREPVVICCTGATASRNYMPGLTEAYYRKLPILAVTCSQRAFRVGNLYPQATVRWEVPSDCVKFSVQCPIPTTYDERKACELTLNRALIELRRHGGGPVHINLETGFATSYTAKELPAVRVISYTAATDKVWPEMPQGKVAVFIGSHLPFTPDETKALEAFVRANDAVVLTDKTSGYHGIGRVDSDLICNQGIWSNDRFVALRPKLLIHIGEMSGSYPIFTSFDKADVAVWRVNEDGEARDRFQKLTAVFEMPEQVFFEHYTVGKSASSTTFAETWQQMNDSLLAELKDLPFSHPWIAQQLSAQLPPNSVAHFAILNSLRAWNWFPVDSSIETMCNVGGFGIDGCLSSVIGSSLVLPEKLHFFVTGDLAFFYDMNALGNRHIGKNLRIVLVNNGVGAEFYARGESAAVNLGEDATAEYIAASRHFGNRSRELVQHYAKDLGFVYLSADSKESFLEASKQFLPEHDGPVLLECFTDVMDDVTGQDMLRGISRTGSQRIMSSVKKKVKDSLSPKAVDAIKSIIHR